MTGLTPARKAAARVAVVNNDSRMRQLLTDALESHGVSVSPYESGDTLLKDARLDAFQVVVSDWTNSP